MRLRFVDCHTHMCPSGDDGVGSVEEGAYLCREAAARGTEILFATPHVWPHLPLTSEREERVRAALADMAPRAGLELRLGFELTPDGALLDEDPRRYALDGTEFVLVEVPFLGSADTLFAVGEHIEAAGLTPVVAHPERTEAVLVDPRLLERIAERGWRVQINATSLLGRHGEDAEEIAWSAVASRRAALVASDGHRLSRPPFLDAAYAAVASRHGEDVAGPLFDGSALALHRQAVSAPARQPAAA